ncbi:MAG: hypothetical protein J6A84_00665 [Clostridia bacterium]|nr:hypothetical protein [Clostridia bacterium]
MMKRVLALILCLASVLLCLTACAKDENDKGAYIRMYLTEPIYDVDPLNAFDNEATLQVVSLLFEGLFYADENGKPQKALVDEYDYTEDEKKGEYVLQMTLKQTKWSDGSNVTASDAQFAFRRLLDTAHPATALIYDIKNARAIAQGNDSVDHLGVTVIDNSTLEIEFEHAVDIDAFLLNLCSPALYPLPDKIERNPNWGKKNSTILTNGPFIVRSMNFTEKDGFILERNSYYYRDRVKDDLDKYVTPFRIVVDYMTDPTEQLKLFDSEEAGALYYFGHIPLAARTSGDFTALLEDVDAKNAPSTHVYYLNQNALIGGEAIFAKAEVRKALSLAINRDAIAEALVYATAADALVPYTLRNRPDRKAEFRDKAASYIATTPNLEEAKSLLSGAGVKASSYSFSITVASYDEDHLATAELVKAAWSALGFNVTVNAPKLVEIVETVIDPTTQKETQKNTGMYQNPYQEALRSGNFEVIALDLVATSPDSFSYLAPFATAFSGNGYVLTTDANGAPAYVLNPHVTGYNSESYNAKVEAAYAAKDVKTRTTLLHEAEAMLMEDMPVIPIVYNQNVSLCSGKLSRVDSAFFCNAVFKEVKLSGHWKIALRDEFTKPKEEEEDFEPIS